MKAILTWHSIDGSGSPISVAASAFAAQVAALQASGVRVVPLMEILNARDPAVALTFDDGFVNFRDAAWPVLRAQGWPVTVFVVAGRAGATNAWGDAAPGAIPELPLLALDDLAGLATEGVTFGSHSRSHAPLTSLPDAAIMDDLNSARAALRKATGQVVDAFAYPYGDCDARVVRIVAGLHPLAVTTRHSGLGAAPDPAALPRLDAWYFRDASGLRRFGSPLFRCGVAARRALRAARRAFRSDIPAMSRSTGAPR